MRNGFTPRAILCSVFAMGAWCVLPACGGASAPTCADVVEPALLIGQEGSEQPLTDGDVITFGDGLQVGGSFVPLRMYARGLDTTADTYTFALSAFDGGRALLASETYTRSMLCIEEGDLTGYQRSPGMHVRFADQLRPELEGKEVTLEVSVTDPEGTSAQGSVAGVMQYWSAP